MWLHVSSILYHACSLIHATSSGCNYNVQLLDVQLNNVQLICVQVTQVQLYNVQVSQVQLNNVQVSQVQLNNVQVSQVQLNNVQVSQVQLSAQDKPCYSWESNSGSFMYWTHVFTTTPNKPDIYYDLLLVL